MHKVALSGLGLMGAGMAKSLLRAGHALCVWNRSSEKAAALIAAGAVIAPTPQVAARGVHAAISMVADDDASREIWLGKTGMLDQLEPGCGKCPVGIAVPRLPPDPRCEGGVTGIASVELDHEPGPVDEIGRHERGPHRLVLQIGDVSDVEAQVLQGRADARLAGDPDA